MRRLDPRADELWEAARADLGVAVVRNAEFYAWRFLDAPAGRENAFVVMQGAQPIGACVLEELGGGSRVRIVDLLAVQGMWDDVLGAIICHVATTRAHTVDIKLTSIDGHRREMWRSGFIEREKKPFLVMLPEHGADERFADPVRWYYTGADSDIDALE